MIHPNLRSVIDRLPEGMRKAAIRRVKIILAIPHVQIKDTSAYYALGVATYKLQALQDLHQYLGEGRGSGILPQPTKETQALVESCREQVRLCKEYISATLAQRTKEAVCISP